MADSPDHFASLTCNFAQFREEVQNGHPKVFSMNWLHADTPTRRYADTRHFWLRLCRAVYLDAEEFVRS